MPATIEIRSFHGASPDSGTNVAGGSVRFKQADNDTVDLTNPIPVPTAGTNYSWIKQFRFYAATAPANTINNLKFYTDGANGYGTGVDLRVKTNASYTDPVAQASAQLAGTSTAFGYTTGSPLAVAGSINNPSTGAFGDYVQTQMSVASTSVQGTTPSENMIYSYDEA